MSEQGFHPLTLAPTPSRRPPAQPSKAQSRQTKRIQASNRIGPLDRIFRRGVLRSLSGIRRGRLTVIEGGKRHDFGDPSPTAQPSAVVTVHDPACWKRVALGGTIGAGEAYMAGEFSCSDLTAMTRLFVVNRNVMNGMEGRLAWLGRAGHWLAHLGNGHSRAGDRRNIAAHYDLGNDFFERFLDRDAMMYSAGIFPRAESSLEEASLAKLDAVCRKLELSPRDHVLEIGTGWGGFACHAARRYGCRVTTTTISRRQYEHAKARVAREGLQGRVEVLLKDYRDLEGVYDKLVSIEMIEAVGHRHLGTFFRRCDALLKPGGAMLLQAITIAEPFHEQARRSVDFIQRYIFPGGSLPSVRVLCEAMGGHSALQPRNLEDIGLHYATTLRHWRERFLPHRDALRAEGYTPSFLRMWEFYLAYCEGGFLERALGTVQMLLVKDGPWGEPARDSEHGQEGRS